MVTHVDLWRELATDRAAELQAEWQKSLYSGSRGGQCVELARLENGDIAMRNSRDPDGTVLVFTQAEMARFLEGL